jgi:hypothetical protein
MEEADGESCRVGGYSEDVKGGIQGGEVIAKAATGTEGIKESLYACSSGFILRLFECVGPSA